MASEEPKDVNVYFVKGYTECHVVLLALDKRTLYTIAKPLAVDSKSGETKYQYKDLTKGAAIYAQGHLYCLDESGTMALLKPGEQSLEEVSRFKL